MPALTSTAPEQLLHRIHQQDLNYTYSHDALRSPGALSVHPPARHRQKMALLAQALSPNAAICSATASSAERTHTVIPQLA